MCHQVSNKKLGAYPTEEGQLSLLIISNESAHRENLPWAANIRKILSTNGMLQEYTQNLNETEEVRYGPITRKLNQRLIDQFNQESFGVINTSSKMKVLDLLKKTSGEETYLTEVTNSKHRMAMTKLRLSGHRLEIETGRYTRPKTDREERLCSYCQHMGEKAVEDEIHFLLKCPMFNEIRESLLPPQNYQNMQLADENKFAMVMANSEINCLKQTAKFIYLAFEERDIKLDVLKTLTDLVASTEILLSKNPDPDEDTTATNNNKNDTESLGRNLNYKIKNQSHDGLKITLCKPFDYKIKNQSQGGLKITLCKI